jgi:hypothetical protein
MLALITLGVLATLFTMSMCKSESKEQPIPSGVDYVHPYS